MTRLDIFNLSFVVLCVVFCTFGWSQFQTDTEDVLQWLPDESADRQEYNRFEERFGSDDFIVITWTGCTVDDPRLAQFSERLTDKNPLIQSVVSGADIIKRGASDLGLSEKRITQRFRGLYFGIKDPKQTLVIVELSKQGSASRRQSLNLIKQVIGDIPDLDLDDVLFGGYPYLGINLDDQLTRSVKTMLFPSFFLATLVSLLCLRNFLLSVIVFVVAVGAAACSVAIVPICGEKFGGLMSIIPSLVFVLATSGSIHLIRYSLKSIGDPWKLISIGWKPCTISALTTAIGMLSLERSSFPAIRKFGFFCAAGTGFALLFQLIVLPWLLTRFGANGQRKLAARASSNQSWSSLVNWTQGRRMIIAFAGVSAMLVAACGLQKLGARVDVDMLFDQKSKIIKSLASLEDQMGPINQSELLVVFENTEQQKFHERAGLVGEIQRSLSSLPIVGTTHSIHNYIPSQPKGRTIGAVVRRSAYQTRLDAKRDELASKSYLDVSENAETWRISLRFPLMAENDVKRQERLAITTAQQVLHYADAKFKLKAHVIYTGKSHLFHSAQLTLLEDLFRNFILAFVIITPVLIVVLRSLSLGLIAMIPNLFPILVMFGTLGWIGFPVDLAIAMTACIALGIAVDDTTHFLMRFRDFGGNLSNVAEPIRNTMSQCGPAMLHTTAIGSAGLIAFILSEMLVIRNFSWAITAMLVIALVADVLVLPAILFLLERRPRPAED